MWTSGTRVSTWMAALEAGGGKAIPPPAPVGGVMMPVNKLAVFAPYLALFGLVVAVTVVAVAPWKKSDTN